MSDEEHSNNPAGETAPNLRKAGEGFVKGGKAFHTVQGHQLGVKFQNSGKFTVYDTATMENIFRFDKPHVGAEFNHININPKVSGLPTDPHIQLPPGAMTAGNGVAKLCQAMNTANKVLVPVAIAIDTGRVGYAGYKDYQNGTSRNLVETSATIAGGWFGGYGGAMSGIALGTAILPGIGTIIGALIGGVGGGVAGSLSSGAVANKIGDAYDYNIEEIKCECCGEIFKARKYQGQKYCEPCSTCENCGNEIKARKYKVQKYCEPCSTCKNCEDEIEARKYPGQKYCEPCSTCISCGEEIKDRKNKGQEFCDRCSNKLNVKTK